MKKRLLGLLLVLVLMLSFTVTTFSRCNCGGAGSGCGDDPVRAIIPYDYETEYEDDQGQDECDDKP